MRRLKPKIGHDQLFFERLHQGGIQLLFAQYQRSQPVSDLAPAATQPIPKAPEHPGRRCRGGSIAGLFDTGLDCRVDIGLAWRLTLLWIVAGRSIGRLGWRGC